MEVDKLNQGMTNKYHPAVCSYSIARLIIELPSPEAILLPKFSFLDFTTGKWKQNPLESKAFLYFRNAVLA
jgi:hypothetical protein